MQIYIVILASMLIGFFIGIPVGSKKQKKKMLREIQNKDEYASSLKKSNDKQTENIIEHSEKTPNEKDKYIEQEVERLLRSSGRDSESIRWRKQEAEQQRKEAEKQKKEIERKITWATQLAVGFGGTPLEKRFKKEREEAKIRKLQLEELERQKRDKYKR